MSLPVRERLPAVAARVEGEHVEVDLASACISQDVTRGILRIDFLRTFVGESPKTPIGLAEILTVDRCIQIAVLPSLLAQERIDPPAAVEPEPEAGKGVDRF